MNMNKIKAKREMLERLYPAGTRVVCDRMEDDYAVPSGTAGTVICVDGIGQIQVAWDNGQSLALNDDCDSFHKVVEYFFK